MSDIEDSSKKVINRSMLIAVSEVLDLFNREDCDSATMGEMREIAFGKLPRKDMLNVLDYCKAPSDYTIIEDANKES